MHSSFRTSSTWLWTKFRAAAGALAYNEVFHEQLATLTRSEALSHRPDSWRSGHPVTDPYFQEYLPLLKPEGGVGAFDLSMAFERFIPQTGIRGDLSQGEETHIAHLIALAMGRGRVAVLTCTRTLGRMAGLKRVFGGTHLFLYRNLFQQWNSYSHQQAEGNSYFMETLTTVIAQDSADPFLRLVRLYLASHCGREVGEWIGQTHYDRTFIAFCGVHLYLAMVAFETADLLVDANRLVDPGYRQSIAQTVLQRSGLPITLDDAVSLTQEPLYPLRDPALVWEQIALLMQAAVTVSNAQPAAVAFAQGLLTDAQAEWQRFSR